MHPHPDLPEGQGAGLWVYYPRRRGRDAADERIVELLDEWQATAADGSLVVVTSDRALAQAARQRGVEVLGARTFLTAMEEAGC